MRFAPSKTTLTVGGVTVLAVGGGVFGVARLLTDARAKCGAEDPAADLKSDHSGLAAASDEHALTPTSSPDAQVTDSERQVNADRGLDAVSVLERLPCAPSRARRPERSEIGERVFVLLGERVFVLCGGASRLSTV